MAGGLAAIGSDAAPTTRILEETGAGVVFRSGDPSSLGDAILSVLDPVGREPVGRAGQEAIRTGFNWDNDSVTLLKAVVGVLR